MELVKGVKWKSVLLSRLFEIDYGNKFDLCALDVVDKGGVALVSRTERNNGVSARVAEVEGVPPYSAGKITVALGGSIGVSSLQTEPFYTGQNVAVLTPRVKMTPANLLAVAALIHFETDVRYVAFGRELNKHIKTDFSIALPFEKGKIRWDLIKPEGVSKTGKVIFPKTKNRTLSGIDVTDWKYHCVGKLFSFENGRATHDMLTEGNGCVYLGAKKEDNSVMMSCAYDPALVQKGNCVVFICNGEGSVGYANYIERDFIATSDVTSAYNEHLNKYIGLFLVAVFDLERPKYSFGRKRRPHLPGSEVLLPTRCDGEPDWEYMESYIKSLPYGDCI